MRVSRPGQSLAKTWTSKRFNELHKKRTEASPQKPLPQINPVKATVYSDTLTKSRFDPVKLGPPSDEEITPVEENHILENIRCEALDEPTNDNFAILQSAIDGSSCKAVVLGLTWANVTMRAEGDQWASIENGELFSGGSGPVKIIKPSLHTGGAVYPYTGPALCCIIGSGAVSTEFFKLIEDMTNGHGNSSKAEFFDWDGNSLGIRDFYNWGDASTSSVGILDDVRAGYWGTAEMHRGKWRFEQGPCIDDWIHEPIGSISGAATDGEVDVAYSYTPTVTDIDAASISASDLPPGLSIDDTTGEISGTPTTAGTYNTIVTGTSDTTGGGSTTVTRHFEITIAEASS